MTFHEFLLLAVTVMVIAFLLYLTWRTADLPFLMEDEEDEHASQHAVRGPGLPHHRARR